MHPKLLCVGFGPFSRTAAWRQRSGSALTRGHIASVRAGGGAPGRRSNQKTGTGPAAVAALLPHFSLLLLLHREGTRCLLGGPARWEESPSPDRRCKLVRIPSPESNRLSWRPLMFVVVAVAAAAAGRPVRSSPLQLTKPIVVFALLQTERRRSRGHVPLLLLPSPTSALLVA